jgi:Serine dehydrogenase proteinase
VSSVKRFFKAIFSWRGFVALLFVLFFVVPVVQSWRIETLRENAIRTLEKNRGSRVIVLIHRQESVNVLGIPVISGLGDTAPHQLVFGKVVQASFR